MLQTCHRISKLMASEIVTCARLWEALPGAEIQEPQKSMSTASLHSSSPRCGCVCGHPLWRMERLIRIPGSHKSSGMGSHGPQGQGHFCMDSCVIPQILAKLPTRHGQSGIEVPVHNPLHLRRTCKPLSSSRHGPHATPCNDEHNGSKHSCTHRLEHRAPGTLLNLKSQGLGAAQFHYAHTDNCRPSGTFLPWQTCTYVSSTKLKSPPASIRFRLILSPALAGFGQVQGAQV